MADTKQILQMLRDYESRNITFMEPDGSWPIVWERARGIHVWGADGRKYFDLTAAFGVAAAGHANPRVVRAGQRQMSKLLHAMGDVHPHPLKAQLARKLSALTFERWTGRKVTGKTIFTNSGFEAVEAALKTALLATGKPGVIAFEGAYHGLGYGALNATHREHFRVPFQSQLGRFVKFLPFPKIDNQRRSHATAAARATPSLEALEKKLGSMFRQGGIGAVLVEPVQARGGINIPPMDFLPLLRKVCDVYGALLIFDEVYTGFGRTGKWFACEHSRTAPDVICLGKALTGGFPLSACVGRAEVMDSAWPPSTGEAIHTSTFLGHPVGCAMALAQIAEIGGLKLPERAARMGDFLLDALRHIQLPKPGLQLSPRGLGLMAGLELTLPSGQPATAKALSAIKTLLRCGYIFLPEGAHANVIGFTPPLTITKTQLAKAVEALAKALRN